MNEVRPDRTNSTLNVNDEMGESSVVLVKPAKKDREVRTYHGPLYEAGRLPLVVVS